MHMFQVSGPGRKYFEVENQPRQAELVILLIEPR